MYLRAAAAAALALLISGDVVRLGWDAIQLWHFIFPYFWLFLLLESGRARRRIEDGTVFLAGAAMAMLYGGVYAKDLQHGFHPLGIDWLGSLCSIFDGGMISVLAMHVTERLKPRHRDEAAEMGLLTSVFLVFCLGAAGVVYGIKTTFNFYRADRMLGATWLLADILFGAAAWKLARRALARSVGEGEEGREPWVWALAAFGVWLPGARFSARVCDVIELPDVLLYFVVGVWTAAAVGLSWRLWRERGHFDHSEVVKSRPAAGAVLWRATGALLIVAWLGADLNDARAGGVFSIAIDLPTRALFALAFLTAKLKV